MIYVPALISIVIFTICSLAVIGGMVAALWHTWVPFRIAGALVAWLGASVAIAHFAYLWVG